jgi:hypothetical protein
VADLNFLSQIFSGQINYSINHYSKKFEMKLSKQDLEWRASVYPYCPCLWIMPRWRKMQFKAQDITNRFNIFTLRLFHPEEATPRTRLSGSMPSLEILWRDNFLALILETRPPKHSFFFRVISNSETKNYMQFCVFTLSIELHISELHGSQSSVQKQ